MSYNILKSKVNFVGDDTPEIEGMVDTSSDQTISGSKDFETISGSNARFSGPVFIDDSLTMGINKRLFFDGTSDTTDEGPYIQGNTTTLSLFCDNTGQIFFDEYFRMRSGSSPPVTVFEVTESTVKIFTELSCSNVISASAFYGDGSQLTNLGQADSVLATNIIGNIDGSQISASTGLTTEGNNLAVDLKSQGALADDSGLTVDIGNSPNQGSFNNSHYILVSGSTIGNKNLQLSELESNLDLAATQISSGQLDNARMPSEISVSELSASTTISGAYFEGDGSGLTGVTGNPTPGGANTEIQFNDDDSLTGSPDLTFFTGSQTLATTNISASSNISGSSLYLQEEIIVGGQTFLDIEGDVSGGNASFIEITASSEISSSRDIYAENFRGNGNTLNNVPLGTYANSNIVFCDSTADTITSNANLRWSGTQLITTGLSASSDVYVGGFVSASSYASANGTLIDSEGNFQGNNAFFNEITGSSLFLESDSTDVLPQIHIHEDDTEYGRISFTNNADTNGSIGAFSHEWTLAGSSSAQGSPTDAQFNIFYGDAQGNGSGRDILSIDGIGDAALKGTLALNCYQEDDTTSKTDPSTLTGHAHIYSKLVTGHAEVFVRDSNGNVTQISPHTPEGEWQYFSRNTRTGKVVRVNMERMIRKLEEITGESFMEEWYEDPTDPTP